MALKAVALRNRYHILLATNALAGSRIDPCLIVVTNFSLYHSLQLLITKVDKRFPIDEKTGCFAHLKFYGIVFVLLYALCNQGTFHIFFCPHNIKLGLSQNLP